jgi:hypothetical protein
LQENDEMVIGRSEDRDNPPGPKARFDAASLFGTRSAHPIWASGLPTAPTGRTYDRKQPIIDRRFLLAGRGPSTYGSRLSPRISIRE